MKCSWKFWVIVLSIISILLLLMVAKLIYDKKNQDSLKAHTPEYIESAELALDAEVDLLSTQSWALLTNTSVSEVDKEQLLLRRNLEFEGLLQDLKVNVSSLPWRTIDGSTDLGRKLRVTQAFPTAYLLSASKLRTLFDLRVNITNLREREEDRILRMGKTAEFEFPLRKHLNITCKQDVLNKANWLQYQDRVGRAAKPSFPRLLTLMNSEAVLNKEPHASAYWLAPTYEMEALKVQELLNRLWAQLRPFYAEFHAYLRGELKFNFVGLDIPPEDSLQAQFLDYPGTGGGCSMIREATMPYPGRLSLNITEGLLRRRYSPVSMAKFAEDFLVSLGLPSMSPSFWSESRFEWKGHDACETRLYEFRAKKDFRLSTCAGTNEEGLNLVNRLLVRSTFRALVSHQSFLFRQPITPGLTEALEDGLLLGMSRQPYLRRMGLLDEYEEDQPATLNRLYREAFDLLPILTRALVFNQWFWDCYTEKVKPSAANCHYWKVRNEIEGVRPPEPRIKFHFDPATQPNLVSTPAANIQSLFRSVLKFQVYEALCRAEEPRDRNADVFQDCDLTGKFGVGEVLSKVISAGSSRSWTGLLGLMGAADGLNATALLQYFKPLHVYLKEVNWRRELKVGWRILDPLEYCARN